MISFKDIIKTNKDIVALYRTKIYLSNNKIIEMKIFRLIVLVKIFFEKHVLKKNITEKRDKLVNNVPYYTENRISKRRLASTLKSVLEKDIIFIDVFDVILNTTIYKEDIFNYYNAKELPNYLFEINLYGKMICDVLEENNKTVYFLLDEKRISKKYIKELLNNNGINNFKDIFTYSSKINNRNKDILSLINNKFIKTNKFAYIGRFFREKKSNEKRDFLAITHENCRFWGEKFRPEINESIPMSIYASMINNKLHQGLQKYTRAYEFGYCYGGIISYYIFVQTVINKSTFEVEFNKFKTKLLSDFNNNKIIQLILDLTFPKVINNFVYDGTEKRENIELKDFKFKKQYKIQEGIIDFSKEYEEKLVQINNKNEIEYEQIKEVINFLLKHKNNTKKMLKECC